MTERWGGGGEHTQLLTACSPSSRELLGTLRQEPIQRPRGVLLTDLLLIDHSVCCFELLRTTWPDMALSPVGWTHHVKHQSRKMPPQTHLQANPTETFSQ